MLWLICLCKMFDNSNYLLFLQIQFVKDNFFVIDHARNI